MNDIEKLQKIIDESERIVFFTGAGVSTDSNIPDFRSTDGLYNQQYAYPPETILSHTFFRYYPEEFFRFYYDKMIYPDARPNATHIFIAECESKGKSLGVVTQNIDGLHQAAGSTKVYELHGSVARNYCSKCGKFYSLDDLPDKPHVPHCTCGGVIKPDVVLYEEILNEDVVQGALHAISNADTLIICGTSLNVYPAAGFLHYFCGNNLVLINKSTTPYDSQADLLIQKPLAEVLPLIKL